MTREEAIKLLNKWYGLFPSEAYEALDMAIEALSNAGQHVQHVGSVDLISRQDAIDALGEEPDIWNDTEEEWAYRNAWVEHISAIKSLPSADMEEDVARRIATIIENEQDMRVILKNAEPLVLTCDGKRACFAFRHFFRKLVCKNYYRDSHRNEVCSKRTILQRCEWYWCPKRRKGGEA